MPFCKPAASLFKTAHDENMNMNYFNLNEEKCWLCKWVLMPTSANLSGNGPCYSHYFSRNRGDPNKGEKSWKLWIIKFVLMYGSQRPEGRACQWHQKVSRTPKYASCLTS